MAGPGCGLWVLEIGQSRLAVKPRVDGGYSGVEITLSAQEPRLQRTRAWLILIIFEWMDEYAPKSKKG